MYNAQADHAYDDKLYCLFYEHPFSIKSFNKCCIQFHHFQFLMNKKHAERDIPKLTNEKLHTLKFAFYYMCYFFAICRLKFPQNRHSACWKTPFCTFVLFCKLTSSFNFHFMDSLRIM